MKVSQDIVFTRLNRTVPCGFVKRMEGSLEVDRPVFFTPSRKHEECVVVISPHDLDKIKHAHTMYRDVLFVCTGPHSGEGSFGACSVLSPSHEVDPAELLNALQSIYGLLEIWEESLKNTCFEEGSFQDLIDGTVPVMFDPICILDKDFCHVAYCENSVKSGLAEIFVSENSGITQEVFSEIIADPSFPGLYKMHTPFVDAVGRVETISQNLFCHDQYAGRIVIQCSTENQELVRYYSALLPTLAVFAERLYARFGSFRQKRESKQGNLRRLFVDTLKGTYASETAWDAAMAECGWEACTRLLVVQFRTHLRYDKNTYSSYTSELIEEMWVGCVPIDYGGALVLLVNLDSFSSSTGNDFNQALSYFVRENLLVAGLSKVFDSPKGILQAYEQTETALSFGVIKNPTYWRHHFEDYVLDYLLYCCTSTYEPEQVCSAKLLKLQEYDKRKGTDYFETLLKYFECAFNAVEAAKRLYIHRNTFVKRMLKIKELVNIDYGSFDELLYLYVSFKLLEGSGTADGRQSGLRAGTGLQEQR